MESFGNLQVVNGRRNEVQTRWPGQPAADAVAELIDVSSQSANEQFSLDP
ncbi:hypothetical protein QYH69_27395 [Paraburkholderia sp. SARCC-3016]|nr:hypothetical protein [Paraburkholderia sp. SARCC-3016]MDQ7980966.1 hypothetical protein [Paraburkholderia sp. SARCC-3016]